MDAEKGRESRRVLAVSDLVFGHKTFRVLPVSFSVAAGQMLAIVGPSGSGKTSLLRVVAGLNTTRTGSVDWCGGDAPIVCFQEARLLPWKTITENVLFALGHRAQSEERSRADQYLKVLGIASLSDRYPDELSGGQRRRVAIARTLVVRQPVVLVDEPFAHLDDDASDRVVDALGMRSKEGAAILVAVHSTQEAARLGCGHVHLEHQGS